MTTISGENGFRQVIAISCAGRETKPGNTNDDDVSEDGAMLSRGPMPEAGVLSEDGAMPPRGPADAPMSGFFGMSGSLARRSARQGSHCDALAGATRRGPMPEDGSIANYGSL